MSLWKERDRLLLKVKWSPGVPDLCKSIAGANWSKMKGAWTYPFSLHTYERIREAFPDEPVNKELAAEMAALTKRNRHLQRLSQRSDARLSRLPLLSPRITAAMAERTYQRVGCRYGANAGNFLLADEPGLGKTVQYLGVLIESGQWRGENLVIAPKTSLESTWGDEIRKWTPDAEVVAMPEGAAARRDALALFDTLDEPKFLVVNPAMIRREYGHWCRHCDVWEEDKKEFPPEHHLENHRLKRAIKSQDWPEIIDRHWSSVVLDESHELLAAYLPSNITQQVAGLLDIKSDRRIALSGTPVQGRETRLWGTLDWLGVNTGGYWSWVDEFFEVASNGFGKRIDGLREDRKEAFYRSIDPYILRRTRAEARPDLPIGQRMDVLVRMTPKQRKQYEAFESMGEAQLESGLMTAMGALAEIVRLKQLAYGAWDMGDADRPVPTADSPKWEWLRAWLRERGVTGKKTTEFFPESGGYKYIVASQFTEILDAVEKLLNKEGIKTLKITGKVTGKRRTDAQRLFQSTDRVHRVLLLNTATGGVSLSLDAWCDEMVIMDETFIADDQVQLEGRNNNRSGRVAPRTWWYLRTEDTVEQSIAEGNYDQHKLQHDLLDGRRGVKVALHLIRGEPL